MSIDMFPDGFIKYVLEQQAAENELPEFTNVVTPEMRAAEWDALEAKIKRQEAKYADFKHRHQDTTNTYVQRITEAVLKQHAAGNHKDCVGLWEHVDDYGKESYE